MIAIDNLHFSYRKKRVFTGLSLNLAAGYIYGLLGKNGTGKTTLLRNIAGMLFPQQGTVRVFDEVPGNRRPAFLQQVFMVPEEFYLPDMPVQHLVQYHAPFYAAFNRSQFSRYLLDFGIPEEGSMQDMSYGQKKKVLISFGLATNAALLLMDEPTNGLDIMSKSQFRKVIAGCVDEKKCILISTHQVKDLENLIDRITIIDEGRILFDQTTEAIAGKLSFRMTSDPEVVQRSLYNESTLRGNVVVTENKTGDESKVDLELLYKAIVTNPQQVHAVFTT